MTEQVFTFEQIDAHIRRADLAAFQPGGAQHFTSVAAKASPGEVLQKVCAIYAVVRPFLKAIEQIPFIPKNWRDAIKTFTDLLDGVCGL